MDQSSDFKEFANVRYVRHDPPNAQTARNLGIRLATGDILIFVDDDVRLAPDFIASHLNNFLEDSTLDGVSGQVLDIGQQPTSEFPSAYYWPHTGWMHFPLNFAERRLCINWPSCNASIRRDMALLVGGFDEQFIRTWWDDADFSWRLHLAGARVVFDPRASLIHLKTPSGGKRPKGLNEFVLADTERWGILFYFWRKHFGVLRARRILWRHVRGIILRKVLAVRPSLQFLAVVHLIAGYRWASERMRQGPIYLQQPSEKESDFGEWSPAGSWSPRRG